MLFLGIVFCVVILAYGIYLIYIARKASLDTKNISDFLSFGSRIDNQTLERTFEGTNATFLTSFVALFVAVFSLGLLTFWIPVGFCLGIIFFNYLILPRMIIPLSKGVRISEFLSDSAGSKFLRYASALIFIFNIWLFTYTEIQGFHLFLSYFFGSIQKFALLLPVIIIAIIALYSSIGGYKAVLLTDRLQVYILRIGIFAILIFTIFILIRNNYFDGFVNSNLPNLFASTNFIISTIVGFSFSQVLYYDNWQRLSYYVVQKSKIEKWNKDDYKNKLNDIVKSIRKNYNIGAFILFFIYCTPIFLAISSISDIKDLNNISPSTLSIIFSSLWNNEISFVSVMSVIFLIIVLLTFFSALMTTADSYIIGAVGLFAEDVLGLFSEKDRDDNVTSETATKKLNLIRIITAFFSLSFLPFVFIEPNFEKLFMFMFYSANGSVGPILYALLNRKLNKYTTFLSLILCIIYAYLFIYTDNISSFNFSPFFQLIFEAGFFTVLLSLTLSFIGTKRK